MSTITRRAAIGTAVLAAAIPLSSGSADAEAAGFAITAMSASADIYGCELTTESCRIDVVKLTDLTTPISIQANGTILGTVTPLGTCCSSTELIWTPQQAGRYTLYATQGKQTATLDVNIIDYNSTAGVLKRYFGINTGS
ncbi:hypothetical protein [Nocardia sp. CDC160]|uniref:hypothetical protein n=1 Tax=Nocardia sp. CDC160 TaxID=3112166 RepID=UPI002DBC9C53|nr:hypothetical protein [Nocardia sp. CDC160]MEC3918890.1 hypothetical protein [Nocardia sp. CDC160]